MNCLNYTNLLDQILNCAKTVILLMKSFEKQFLRVLKHFKFLICLESINQIKKIKIITTNYGFLIFFLNKRSDIEANLFSYSEKLKAILDYECFLFKYFVSGFITNFYLSLSKKVLSFNRTFQTRANSTIKKGSNKFCKDIRKHDMQN
ncbi:hypothetical protein BpHYR1_020953 [Brachionus plicatilis]|uniref:Uncharacterized protein n=1 Tax=Brachionus plicatilis TaxID=10195 RepID=A0A3M7RSY4_BRAPC|nr:hypothetical protein BpHYR1_020953 [Brachionus plicatilis]